MKIITHNRKASYEYQFLEKFEAGLVLWGTEVKSMRQRAASLADAYVGPYRQELYLIGCHIAPYTEGNRENHEPRRRRKLLMHKREILRLIGKVNERGLTLVPTKLYFKEGRVKLEFALARGKRTVDKRHTVAKRDADREIERALSRRRRR